MIDVTQQVNAVARKLGDRMIEAGAARTLTISQSYPTTIEDLWDACTNPERLPRWFLPVSGDLRVGGTYQIENNANGTIQECDPPHSFTATWEYDGVVSWIELRLTSEAPERSRFELTHIAVPDEHWDLFGPGAAGIGWDLALVGLALHLARGAPVDPTEVEQWSQSPAGKHFVHMSSERWYAADVAAGADPNDARASADRTAAFYTGETDLAATPTTMPDAPDPG